MSRVTSFLLAIGATALVLAAPLPARALETIKMIYTNGFTLHWVAEDEGFFKKRGIDMKFVETASTGNVPGAIVGGSVDIGGATPASLLQADEAGLDLVVIGGGQVYPLPGDDLVARQGSGIKKATDLKGKSVGIPAIGGTAYTLLRRSLKQNHVDPDSVKYVEVGFPQAADALKNGQIDAYLLEEPFTTRALQTGAGYVVADWLKDTPDGTLTVLTATTRKWALAHKKELAAIRAGMEEAQTFVKTHKAETDAIVAKYTGVPLKIVASVGAEYFVPTVTPKQLQFWIDICREQHLIKSDMNAEHLLVE